MQSNNIFEEENYALESLIKYIRKTRDKDLAEQIETLLDNLKEKENTIKDLAEEIIKKDLENMDLYKENKMLKIHLEVKQDLLDKMNIIHYENKYGKK